MKSAIGSLLGVPLELQIALSSIVIFTVLILPLQEHGIAFHLFVSFFNFLDNFQSTDFFVSLGRFISMCFIHFDAMVKEIFPLNFTF